jgi:integrase
MRFSHLQQFSKKGAFTHMISQNDANGSQNASIFRDTSPSCEIVRDNLQTVDQLLDEIARRQPNQSIPMLRTTADHFANYVGVRTTELTIEFLESSLPGFKRYLLNRKLARNSVKSYRDFAVSLLRQAGEFGWVRASSRARTAWDSLPEQLRRLIGCRGLVRYAIAKDKAPFQLNEGDLAAWAELMVEEGRNYNSIQMMLSAFRRAIRQENAQEIFPLISVTPKKLRWGIPVKDMPEPLRAEILALLKWKTDAYVPGRPRGAQHRPITAKQVADGLARLYGFAVKHMKRDGILQLTDLVSEVTVGAYISWALNDRKLRSISLHSFTLLCAALKQHPAYKNNDLKWLDQLLSCIPSDSESDSQERKASKYLPYGELSKIPNKIAQAGKLVCKDTRKRSLLFRNELLLRWLLILPWRQRNIREARLGTAEKDNIFKAGFTPLVNIAKPAWVEEELKRDPNAQFWQIFFRKPETKTGQEIRGVVPKQLVPFLEEYLQYHRPLLVTESDPRTLFLNNNGCPISLTGMTALVGNLTARYAGRRVTPHLFRDSFAHCWLDDHPADYLTLSKILWHRSIQTTIRTYGRNYDESHGMRKTETWIEQRG